MQLEDWLDDLCVRFIINLPPEELESVERICFQVEEAQWFYEDFIRPLDPSLPSLNLRAFSLRIFQHCPLFAQWDAEHYTTAFSEFLAYKSRVPVRGAIMLNEAMDKVVLVKGWKKGANWSFPRGKINKDEDDLDCAVREVYEETGLDLKEAGLVTAEKDMKYIEVTMREQHMRLYVFRGVPMDTFFEPKTRKEISKIEWYNLTDLPTLKRNKHQDGPNENLAVNANKFYMVAPFLNPLKKWISQQRKQESHTGPQAHLAPHILVEDTVTEDEPDLTHDEFPLLGRSISQGPSDLPEVSLTATSDLDPSQRLKQMLNVNPTLSVDPSTATLSTALPPADNKSSALLALLRSGSSTISNPNHVPHTPLEQISFSTNMPPSPHHAQPSRPPFSTLPPPPPFPIPPELAMAPAHNDGRTRHDSPRISSLNDNSSVDPPASKHTTRAAYDYSQSSYRQIEAPYQVSQPQQTIGKNDHHPQASTVPLASALPVLTNHTRALLDAFKTGSKPKSPPESVISAVRFSNQLGSAHSFNAIQKQNASVVGESAEIFIPQERAAASSVYQNSSPNATVAHRPQTTHQSNLLHLFRQPSEVPTSEVPSIVSQMQKAPVELAAQSTPEARQRTFTERDHRHPSSTKDKHGESEEWKVRAKYRGNNLSREGQTSATISGPLNQPQFEGIARSPRHAPNSKGFARSPKPTNRTLYDPNQPTPVKILHRTEQTQPSPVRSPNTSSTRVMPSSRGGVSHKEQPKPFHPQILRRPDVAEQTRGASPILPRTTSRMSDNPDISAQSSDLETPLRFTSPPEMAATTVKDDSSHRLLSQLMQPSPQTNVYPPAGKLPPLPPSFDRRTSQDASQRNQLLALFNKPSKPPQTDLSPLLNAKGEKTPGSSKLISPLDAQESTSAYPISTRSRMGSLASLVSGASHTVGEKRQTTAGDREFLLGYLGRIASQEG